MPSVLGIDITTEAEAKRAAEAKKKYYGYMKQRGMYVKLLQDIKKKYNWTDKDLKDKGLWSNAVMDPYIKYLSESNIKMAGGKVSIPVNIGLPEAVVVTPVEAARSGEPGPDAAALRAIDNATNAAEAILNDPRISSSSSAADVQNIAASRSIESGTRARQMTLLEEKGPPISIGDIPSQPQPPQQEQKAPVPPATSPPRGTSARPKKKGPSQRNQLLTNILGSEPSGTGSVKLRQATDEILRDNPMPADWESNKEYQDKITKALQDTIQYKNYVEARRPIVKRQPVISIGGIRISGPPEEQPEQKTPPQTPPRTPPQAPPQAPPPPPNLREIAMNKIAQESDVNRIFNDVEQRARQRIDDVMTNNLTEAQRNAIIEREFKRASANREVIKRHNEFGTKLTIQRVIDNANRLTIDTELDIRDALERADEAAFNENKNRPSSSSSSGGDIPVRAPDPSYTDTLLPSKTPTTTTGPIESQYPEVYPPSKTGTGVRYPIINPPLRDPTGVFYPPQDPNAPWMTTDMPPTGPPSMPPQKPPPQEPEQKGPSRATDQPPPMPPMGPPSPQPEPDQPERKEPLPREKPIPLPPKEEPKPPKRKEKPPKDEPPKDKAATKDTNLPQGVKNQGGYGYLRPFFDDYHGIDLLTQTEAESLEDIREFELFDVPIDPNQNLNNPVFVAWLRNQQFRFSGYGIDPNFHKSAQLAAIREETAQLNGDKDIYSNVRPTYNSFMEAEPILQEPTPIWYDPYNHDRPRGVGVFSEAYRTEASEAFAWAEQTNIHPDLVQMTKYKPDAPFNIRGSISDFVRPVIFHEPGGMSANA